MCTVLGVINGNGASDAAPQEPHDINWLQAIIAHQERELAQLRQAGGYAGLIEKARGLLGHRVLIWPAFDQEKSGPPIWEGYVAGVAPNPTLSVIDDGGELQTWMVTLPHEDLGEVGDPADADLYDDDEDLGEDDVEVTGLRDFSTGDPAVAAEAERSIIATALALAAAGVRRREVATEYAWPTPAARDAALQRADDIIRDGVRIARADGASWIQVGETLSIEPLAARERFTPGVTE